MPPSIDFQSLPISERIRLVQEIWDSIAAESATQDIPPWQQAELDRRLKECDQDPGDVESWDEVRRGIESELRS